MRSAPSSPIRRVLIANRGEIAVRIIRACHDSGIEAVAIHSTADRRSPHVWLADRALEIGPAPASESYLDVERVLDAARRSDADAIHPGYGFLAENDDFATAVQAAGLVWIGPPPDAMRTMGEKTAARRAMQAAGVPVTPGTLEPATSLEALKAAADSAGYPVLLKAAAGGGGKGMRVVRSAEELPGALRAAASEARNAFGDPAVYLEKYVPSARHVEIQVMADGQGRAVHLGERECSLQRRHQKILEESPAPGLGPETRQAMGEVAVRAAHAVGYVGAGTVEFLLAADGTFWFLEMNTRLQVEHPVTEMVTGFDLVRLQLAIADGAALPFEQEDVAWNGHAIECRIAAEDAESGFLPATGEVVRYREPAGPGVRFDSGIAEGLPVTPYYDPLLAKCITWGATREDALARMERALAETEIGGVTTNLPFLRALLDDPGVRSGRVDTRYLEAHADRIRARIVERRADDEPLAAALASLARHAGAGRPHRIAPVQRGSRWRAASRFVWY
ncbi:MAG: acetyl/propionyl/methylcrotonyl-CoA carboxylase subunit alpha [Gemmatimonadota bacterium]